MATGGFRFENVEGRRATLHDNETGKSCSRAWFTKVHTLLIRKEVRFPHRAHNTNMAVSIAGPDGNVSAMDRGDADVRL
jgi:hypothetical protein